MESLQAGDVRESLLNSLTARHGMLHNPAALKVIILQSFASGRYLGPNHTWVTSCQEARRFDHTYMAALEGLKHSERCQIVWCMGNPKMSIFVSVRAEDSSAVFPCKACPLAAKSVEEKTKFFFLVAPFEEKIRIDPVDARCAKREQRKESRL